MDDLGNVDISNVKDVERWFDLHPMGIRSLIACRAALRVLLNIVIAPKDGFNELALTSFRALLVACLRSKEGRKSDTSVTASLKADLAANRLESVGKPESDFGAAVSSVKSAAFSAAISAISAASAIEHSVRSAHISSARTLLNSSQLSSEKFNASRAAITNARGAISEDIADLETGVPFKTLWFAQSDSRLQVPKAIRENFAEFLQMLSSDRDWVFWQEWFVQMIEGSFQDWELARAVADIKDTVWEGEDALSQVAALIREIEAELQSKLPRPDNVPVLEQSKLIHHVKRLLASPEMTALAADGAAETLSNAIADYLKPAPANCLPDQLAHFQHLPGLFAEISKIVKSDDLAKIKEKQLTDTIEELNAEVAKLEAALKIARSKSVNGIFTQNALAAAGKAFGAGAIGTLSLATVHFFGHWPDDLTFENLREWLSSLENATPKLDDRNSLPPATDV